jgi:tetratricopeptide (TPR) repeat protein
MAASLVADLAKLPDTLVVDLAPATAAAGRQPGSERTAREAGARHVLSGTAQRHGDRVQVYARLASSRDGTILWSERFDYAGIADGAWQRDVSLRIARAVDWRMTEAAATAAGQEARLAPAEAVLRGQYLLRHWTDYPDLVRARRHFEAVLVAQPQSAAAWAGLAQSHLSEVDAGLAIGQASIDRARHAVARARAVNPDYLPAKVSSGILLAIEANPEAALRVFEAVAAANPIDPWMPARIAAMKLRLGRLEEVQVDANAALRLSPFEAALVCYSHLFAGFAQYYLGDEDRAYEHMRMVLAAAPCPTQPRALMLLASLDALHGRTQEANEHAAALMRLRPHFTVSGWRTLTAPAHPRIDPARQRFLEGLAKAGLPE